MAFDLAEHVLAGYRFSQTGALFDVVAPDGRHGSGASPEEAVLNIGSVIIPVQRPDYEGRLRIREDGSEVQLDVSGIREVV